LIRAAAPDPGTSFTITRASTPLPTNWRPNIDLLLIRHGLPLHIENDTGEPADPPLSEIGRLQARHMSEWLAGEQVDRLYSSPMRRALETAEPLAEAKGLTIELHDGVAEYDRDAASYVPVERLKEVDYDRWLKLMRGETEADFDLFSHQVIAALDAIVDDNAGRRVAVACHGGVINVWTAHVIGFTPRLFFNPDYTSINRFVCARSGERSVRTLNEAVHLREVQG
jgi:probable phosphoglycerate mutase